MSYDTVSHELLDVLLKAGKNLRLIHSSHLQGCTGEQYAGLDDTLRNIVKELNKKLQSDDSWMQIISNDFTSCNPSLPQSLDIPEPTQSLDIPEPTQPLDIPEPTQSLDIPEPTQSLDIPEPPQPLDIPEPVMKPRVPQMGGRNELLKMMIGKHQTGGAPTPPISTMERILLIAVTFLIRSAALMFVSLAIERKWVSSVDNALKAYVIAYTIVFAGFVGLAMSILPLSFFQNVWHPLVHISIMFIGLGGLLATKPSTNQPEKYTTVFATGLWVATSAIIGAI